MQEEKGKDRVALRYALYQLPFLGLVILAVFLLHEWAGLEAWLCWAIVVGWMVKDAILFPFLKKAYDQQPVHSYSALGARAVVVRRLDPRGMVKLKGELWQAHLKGEGKPLETGTPVRIAAQEGPLLLVEEYEPDQGQVSRQR